MAKSRIIIDTSDAYKRIESLQKQIDIMQNDLSKGTQLTIDTKIAEAQIKGLQGAISNILKDISNQVRQSALGTQDLLNADGNIKKLKDLSNQINVLYKEIADTGGTKTQIAELNRLNASFNGTLGAIKRIGTEEQKQAAEAIKLHKNKMNRIVDEKKAIENLSKTETQRMNSANKSMAEYQKLINEYISLVKKAENAQNNTSAKNALKPSEEMYMYGYPDGTPRTF